MVARWHGQYDELASARYPALVSYAMAFTGQRATAEDLVQEALLRTFGTPRRLHSAEHAEHYARRAIATAFIDDVRKRERLGRLAPRLASVEVERDAATAIDLEDEVARALVSLSPQARACVILRYYDDLSIDQIAAHLHLANGTVKRYLHDAAATLRTSLGAADAPTMPVVATRGRVI